MKNVLLTLALAAGFASASRIVVNNDEWTLTDAGFNPVYDAPQFAENVAGWLTDGTASNDILLFSDNFGIYNASLINSLTASGYDVTHGNTAGAPTLANLSAYGAVFLAGNVVDNAVLIDYVNGGGNVYLAGGTGWGGPSGENGNWNTFLGAFGLEFGPDYNGICCNMPISGSHPVLAGVDNLLMWNGNTALLDVSADGRSQIIATDANGVGLLGVYDGNARTPGAVPEPGTLALMGLGLGLAALAARRRQA